MVVTRTTRNFLKSWLFPPLKKPIISGFSPVRKLNILLFFPSVLPKSFWKKCGITYTESCPSGRRCSSRNAVWVKPPRVRIPNSPPKSPVNKRVCRTFLFCPFAQNRLKTMERTACFLERTRRFRAFWRIRTVKISSFRHHLKFRSTCCRISPIREASFR